MKGLLISALTVIVIECSSISCSGRSYLNSYYNKCLACNEECLTCTIYQYHCTSCTDSNAVPPYCLTCGDFQIYDSNSGQCVDICAFANEYPLYSSDGTFLKCLRVFLSNDEYCIENLKNLSKNFKFSLRQQSNFYILEARFAWTPQICYTLQLVANSSHALQINSRSQDNHDYVQTFIFSQQDIDSGLISCSYVLCSLDLNVLWGGRIVKVFKISIQAITQSITLQRTIQFNGNYNVVCADCDIPSDKLISSKFQYTCGSAQTCSNSSIETNSDDQLHITQIIPADLNLNNNPVAPHSIQYIPLQNNTSTTTNTTTTTKQFIKNFTYDSSIPGQISYAFLVNAGYEGTLIITSVVSNIQVARRLADGASSSSLVLYPQLSLKIKSNERTNEDSSKVWIIVGVIFGFLVLVIVIALLIDRRASASVVNLSEKSKRDFSTDTQQVTNTNRMQTMEILSDENVNRKEKSMVVLQSTREGDLLTIEKKTMVFNSNR